MTVLRAHVDSDLTPYRNALCGRSGKERFSILLDDSEFLPEMGRLVGFGERLPSEKTVEEILSDANIPEDLSHSLLVSYGLEEYKTTACKQLSECSARRIQLLLATHSSEKVLILDGPFEPLSSQWKERFAELILNDARNKNRITIITRLSFRPENWVGNEMIARLQVGQTVQKTIGFGSNPSEVHAVVGQLRSLLNDEEKVQKILSGQVQVDPNLLSQIKSGSESIAEQRANEPLSKNDSSEFDLKIESKEPLSGQARIQSAYYQYRYISRAAIGMAALVVATFIVALVLKFSSANQSETKIAKLEISVATEKSTSSTSKPSNSGPSQSEKSSNTVQKPENLNSKPSSEEKNLLSALESN
ncbi:MAG: hypothetical protein KDD53_11915, partial [Bdellovibrionales bacterium]|nr:hypothetical protein [Bdellovibrionales bacterium]